MQLEKYTLANGMDSYKITADEGKIIVRVIDKKRCGTSIALGMAFRDKDGNVLDKPYLEKPEDYTEDDMTSQEKESYKDMV
jgi:hypothetical protein